MPYRIEITRRAERVLKRVPARDASRISAALDSLSEEPFPRGTLKLSGFTPPLWRIRVGEYRIVYSVSVEGMAVIVQLIERRTTQTYENL